MDVISIIVAEYERASVTAVGCAGGSLMFVVVVFFEAKAGHVEEFNEAIVVNAAASVNDEPGCRNA